MEIADLARIVDGAEESAFRLETLSQYLVPQEEEEFTAWRSGQPVEMKTPETSSWLAHVADRVAHGIRWYRVHILDHPLSEYSRYEVWGYSANQSAGEEIYLADRAAHPDLQDLREDFWLVDNQIAVRMLYDDEGRFLRPELADDVAPCLAMRATALHNAETLDEYVVRRGLRHTA